MRVDLGVGDAELSIGDPSACWSPREQRSKVNSNTLVKMQRDTSNRRATSPARHSLKPERRTSCSWAVEPRSGEGDARGGPASCSCSHPWSPRWASTPIGASL